MFLVKKVADLVSLFKALSKDNRTLGFVPTMGALHGGHLSLLDRSASDCDITVCSIFVNPTQFDNKEDLERYPRPVEQDIRLLSEKGVCDILFMPSVEEMYPVGVQVTEKAVFGQLENIFEGKFRQGHFQGVAHIISRLLKIIDPNKLYMGQKDFQQCLVVKKVLEQESSKAELVVCPIRREEDGLAMSSRNRLLTEPQRNLAGLLYQCLVSIQAQKFQKDFSTVQKECKELLENKGIKPDYIALADAQTLSILPNYTDQKEMISLIAATVGKVRLIDNLML